MELGLRQVSQIGLAAFRGEEDVALTPEDERLWLACAQELLPCGVERNVGASPTRGSLAAGGEARSGRLAPMRPMARHPRPCREPTTGPLRAQVAVLPRTPASRGRRNDAHESR